MKCTQPDCGGKLKVLRTEDQGTAVFRRRECQECGHRTTTNERPVNEVSDQNAISSGAVEFSIGQLLHSLGIRSGSSIRALAEHVKMIEETSNTNGDTEHASHN